MRNRDIANVNRVEVIDYSRGGRAYTNHYVEELELSIQDDGHTLKLFIWGGKA